MESSLRGVRLGQFATTSGLGRFACDGFIGKLHAASRDAAINVDSVLTDFPLRLLDDGGVDGFVGCDGSSGALLGGFLGVLNGLVELHLPGDLAIHTSAVGDPPSTSD